jgi:Uma2 family endonuclease
MSEATAALSTPADASGVPDDTLYEVIDGRVVEKPWMGAFETWMASRLIEWLHSSADVRRIGQVVSEILFKLESTSRQRRRPDLAFLSYDRWPRGRPAPRGEFWEVVPDLAVEVVSPSNTAADVVKKLGEYFRAGVRLVWVIYPEERLIYAYRSPTDVRILGPGDDLDGEPVLPGVSLPVRELFGEEPAPAAEGA